MKKYPLLTYPGTFLAVFLAGCAGTVEKQAQVFVVAPAAKAAATYSVGTRATGGPKGTAVKIETGFVVAAANWDEDDEADGLRVTLAGLSADNRPVKLSGDIYFQLYSQDSSQLDRKDVLLYVWHIPSTETIRYWRDGIFGGYKFLLEYGPQAPKTEFGVLESIVKTKSGTVLITRDTSVKLKVQ